MQDGRQFTNTVTLRHGCDAPAGFLRTLIHTNMKRYFVIDIHRASDAGAMERELVEYARAEYADTIIAEPEIKKVAWLIGKRQEQLKRTNPRRQEVRIEWGENPFLRGSAHITIGSSQISLRLIRREIVSYDDPNTLMV